MSQEAESCSEIQTALENIKRAGRISGSTAGEVSRAELDAHLVLKLADHLDQLSTELEKSRAQWKESSDVATEQAAALVRWTRVLVGATIAYVVLTGGLLLIALIRSC